MSSAEASTKPDFGAAKMAASITGMLVFIALLSPGAIAAAFAWGGAAFCALFAFIRIAEARQ